LLAIELSLMFQTLDWQKDHGGLCCGFVRCDEFGVALAQVFLSAGPAECALGYPKTKQNLLIRT
jgi:hypothetical protein